MMKKCFLCILPMMVLCSVSHADLLFKMNTPLGQTALLPDEVITVTISAKAEGAASLNGLFGWGLDAIVNTGGVVQIVDGSIQFLAPSPWSVPDTKWDSYNQAVSGGTGSIEYLRLQGDISLFENSTTGADVYTPIAQFDIKAVGAVNDSVVYSLGGMNFGGILADVTTEYSSTLGNVQFAANDSQNVFTIVPEPSSMLILSGLGVIGYLRRKK